MRNDLALDAFERAQQAALPTFWSGFLPGLLAFGVVIGLVLLS